MLPSAETNPLKTILNPSKETKRDNILSEGVETGVESR